jgi:hypothetical protein
VKVQSAEPERRWWTVRVYYFDDQDELLHQAVRALLRVLAGQVERAYFMRHWRLGPHVRVNIRTDSATFSGRVPSMVQDTVGEYLRQHPSTSILREDEVLPIHQRLATLEQEPGPLRPFERNNTIHYGPYESRRAVLGSDAAADMLVELYEATNDLALDTLEDVAGSKTRVFGVGFDLLVATAHVFGSGIARAFVSYRSHAEAFIENSADPENLRRRFEATYQQNSSRLQRRLRTVTHQLEHGRAPDLLHRWIQAVTPLWERTGRLLLSGELVLTERGDPARFRSMWQELKSPLHRLMGQSDAYLSLLEGSPSFQRYRFILNCLYLHLTRLGVAPVDRIFLCHAVANAVEAAYGVSAVDLVENAIQKSDREQRRAGEAEPHARS